MPSLNWTVDELRELIELDYGDNKAVLQAIEHSAESGTLIATGMEWNQKNERVVIGKDVWVDNRLVFSKFDNDWVLALPDWEPLPDFPDHFFGGIPYDRGTITDSNPRYHNLRFREDSIPKDWRNRKKPSADGIKAAISAAAELLKENPDTKRAEVIELCLSRGLSKRQAQNKVWPDAREAAGLPREAPPGPKKKRRT